MSRIDYIPEQLLGPSLVGGESDHLAHQVADKLVGLGQFAFALGWPGLNDRMIDKFCCGTLERRIWLDCRKAWKAFN